MSDLIELEIDSKDTIFKCIFEPEISLKNFAERLYGSLECSDACYIAAAILVSRLYSSHPEYFSRRSVHKILAAAMVCSIKFLDDEYLSNSYYSRCCGIDLRTMNALELEFILSIRYDIFVSADEFSSWAKWLVNC